MLMVTAVSWLAIICAPIVVIGGESSNEQTSTGQLQDTVMRLSRLVEHYKHSPDGLNVDGLYGLRITQGALGASVIHLASSGKERLATKLRKLLGDLTEVCVIAQEKIKKEDPVYYRSFFDVVGQPFMMDDMKLENLPSLPRIDSQALLVHLYNETHGDICYQRVMGTFTGGTEQDYKCFVDKDCFEMMTRPGQHSYSVTHQLLYFIIAQKVGCSHVMNMLLHPRSLRSFQRQICQQILVENQLLLSSHKPHYVEASDIDLFMEQGVLCGMLGFTNFIDINRLTAATAHQHLIGCFKDKRSIYASANRNGISTTEKRNGISAMEKRREKFDQDQCKAHTTGLAAAYMSVYILHTTLSPPPA